MTRLPATKRREQLLDEAAKLFARQGYAKATTSQLAKAAGVTEPIIYRHFKKKSELFVELIKRTGRQTLEKWERSLADASDPAERLRRLIGDNPMVTESGRFAYRVILQAITEVDDPDIHNAVRDHLRSLHAFLVTEVEWAQEEHKVAHRFSAEIIAWLLIYTGLGFGVMSALEIPGHGTDVSGTRVRDVIERLLVGRSRAEESAPAS